MCVYLQTAYVKRQEQLARCITNLLSKDPLKRPSITPVKNFLHELVLNRKAIDKGRATLGQDGRVNLPSTRLLGTAGGGGRGGGIIDESIRR